MSNHAGHALLEAIAEQTAITLSLAELSPAPALAILAEGGQSHRLRVEGRSDASAPVRVTVEVGNGLVVGATARVGEAARQGREAYEALRGLESGSLTVEPLRFPSLANLLVPIEALPDVGATRGPKGEPTVQVRSPPDAPPVEAAVERPRPVPAPEPSARVAPARVAPARVAPPPNAPPPNAPPPNAPPPNAPPPNAPPKPAWPATRAPRARWAPLALAGGALAVIAAAAIGALLRAPEPPPPASGPASVSVRNAPAPSAAQSEEARADPAPDGGRARARRLARAARAALRAGERPRALRMARRAARLRGGLPYYQTLLGDALYANRQPAAARRAYRRALRLRPDYGPARQRLRRLQRRAAADPHT